MNPARLISASACAIAILTLTACARGGAVNGDCAALRADLEPLLASRWSEARPAHDISGWLQAVRLTIERQLVTHDEWIALGWCAFREADFVAATTAFEVARQRVRHSVDAAIGQGHVALRREDAASAVAWFSDALARDAGSMDAVEGLVLAVERLPERSPAAPLARASAEAVLRGQPADSALLQTLLTADRKAGGSGELRRRPDAAADQLRYSARAGDDYLELRHGADDWQPIFVKGVNVGPALPGRFASEAPQDETTWTAWFDKISRLGANAIRVYTLQPPAFYRALNAHNEAANVESPAPPRAADDGDGDGAVAATRLWLIQGVWADLPRDDDFNDAGYLSDFHDEIARVIDAVHGDLVLSRQRGHAQGVYDADVSTHTLAWIIGREWEPYAVAAYNDRQSGTCVHRGRFIQVRAGNAMECWIGATLDFTAAYESRRFGQGRPLSFANWPTLDPLHHPTEATFAERDQWRLKLEGVPIPDRTGPIWNDDAITVDTTLMSGTEAHPAGVFASYHVYPNFPYFMNLEPSFAEVVDDAGVNRYAGYLRALKHYHGRQPVLVAEVGMSTSRGIAHLQPEGLHHGGQHEPDAMRQTARLMRSIHDEAMAGGVVFAFVDEWFKGTWTTNPFERPEEQRPFWFNAESPEQSYGLWAARPLAPVRLIGALTDWAAVPALASAADASVAAPDQGPHRDNDRLDGWQMLRTLRATYDAGYLYLLLETAGRGPVDWTSTTFTLGLDTYASDRGERHLPPSDQCTTATGVEFAVVLAGPQQSAVRVTPAYRKQHPWEPDATGALASPLQPAGRFDLPVLTTNHRRYTRDGIAIADQSVTPGRLRYGSLDANAANFDTRTDVVVGADDGIIEVRLPWALLNFADPSRGQVLHQPAPADELATITTDGIRIYACAFSTQTGVAQTGRLASALPAVGQVAPLLALQPWIMPAYVIEPKHGLDTLASTLKRLPGRPARPIAPATRSAP